MASRRRAVRSLEFRVPAIIFSVMDMLQIWELMSYIVTVVGLPFAILIFIYEQRKERRNEDEEIFQRLSDEYREFLKLVLDNADLQLLRVQSMRTELTEEQKERRLAIFGILISLFERAYCWSMRTTWIAKPPGYGSRGRTTCASG